MEKGLAATATTIINAPASDVWDALVDPEKIKQYMFGTNVVSDFKEGSPITWKGEWKGKAYEDKGVIKRATPGRVLEYTHNEHRVIVELSGDNGTTKVHLWQDNNPDQKAKQESEKNWAMMLEGLKKLLETG
jgi:uncharacterized protein YndB with AHSA1/START domain